MIVRHEDEEEKPLDPAVERVRRKMARLLAVSIAIMMAGILAVLGAIVYKVQSGDGPSAVAGAASPPIEPGIEAGLQLPVGAQIRSVSLDGSNILAHVLLQDGTEQLLIYGVNEERIIARIVVE